VTLLRESNELHKNLQELAQYKQWVVRQADKVPLNPTNGYNASATNPQHWTDYNTAQGRCTVTEGLGLGFVLSGADPYTCIDLDDATNQKHGLSAREISEVQARQIAIIKTFDSYTEWSPSGKGFHIWVKGSIPQGIKLPSHIIGEIWHNGHYMTVTGDVYRDVPIAERQELLTAFYNDMQKGKGDNPTVELVSHPESQSDKTICIQAAEASNGDLFKRLYLGEWQGEYPSQSEADIALCNVVAFYSDNPEQVIRIFRASALGKRKKAQRDDYVGNMVRKAFDQKLRNIDVSQLIANGKQQLFIQKANQVPMASSVHVPTKRHVELTSVATIQPENIKWFWRYWLALGKLAIFAGGPGIGKSTLTLALAATASNGGSWPDGTSSPAGHVLIWTNEDGIADTVVPRLLAAGARLDNVHVISATTDSKGEKLPFSPATDIPLLKEKILATHNVVLLIIDPVVAAVEKDMNQTNIVRKSLQSLVDFANEIGCCVLGITHFRKNSEGQEPLERILGSGAFGALPRTVIVAAKDKSSERRVVALAKGNVGQDTGGFEYTVEAATVAHDIHTSKVVWGNAIEGSARDILASVEVSTTTDDDVQPSSELDEAKRFLSLKLAQCAQVPAIELTTTAGQLGISSITLKRAMKLLGVIPFRHSFGGPWLWRLPLKFDNNTNPIEDHGHLRQNDDLLRGG
jgi:putative DNA primase/helicase